MAGANFSWVLCSILILPSFGTAVKAEELNSEPNRTNNAQPVSVPAPEPVATLLPGPPVLAMPFMDGKLSLGGAVRARADVTFNDVNGAGNSAVKRHFGFDALILKTSYDSSTFFFNAQYNILAGGQYPYTIAGGYKGHFAEINFLKWAYAGYKLNDVDSVTVGLQQVPFGLVPYFGTSFTETLTYVFGVEEFYNIGLKYSHVEKDYNFQLGYFPVDGGNYFGISRDSARYSVNFVAPDSYLGGGTDNVERNMFVARGEYTVYRKDDVTATVGGSVFHSSLYSNDTQQMGSRQMEAIHLLGTYGPWTLRTIGGRMDIDPRNPNGQNSMVTMGSYDGSYNVASKGWFQSQELSYKYTASKGPFTDIVPYVNYSAYYKDRADFKDSERYIVGAALTIRDIPGLYIYTELRIGRNDPYVGIGQYGQGLAAGGSDKFYSSLLTNIGYYF